MYRHGSAVTHVVTEVYHFHGVDHADILDLWCCHVGNPVQTNELSWYDSMTWILKAYWILNLGGHFSLAMCIKVNWYLKCNQVDVKSQDAAHSVTVWDVSSWILAGHVTLGHIDSLPETWSLKFRKNVLCSYGLLWCAVHTGKIARVGVPLYPHSRKTWFVLLGMHGLFKVLNYATMWQIATLK